MEQPKFDPENPMGYFIDQMKRIENLDDTDPNTCLIVCEIMEKPLAIIAKRATEIPVMGVGYVLMHHDVEFLTKTYPAILDLIKKKLQHEIGMKNAGNSEVPTKTENNASERFH